MPLTITDEQLARIDLTPERLKLEIAVMLREKDKMSYRAAAGLAGLSPAAFCDLLRERDVPWIHIGGTTEEEALEYIRQDAVLSRGLPGGAAERKEVQRRGAGEANADAVAEVAA